MRSWFPLAALLLSAQLLPAAPAEAAHHAKKGGKAAMAAGPMVTITAKTVLRSGPSEDAKGKAKLKPKDRLMFVQRSPDGKWAQVRKGKVAGWVAVDEVEGLPDDAGGGAVAEAPDKAAPDKASPDKAAPDKGAKQEDVSLEPVGTDKPAAPDKVAAPVKSTPEAQPAPAQPVAEAPPAKIQPEQPPATEPPKAQPAPGSSWGGPLYGPWASVGGGVTFLSSHFTSHFNGGLDPELFKYALDNLPAVGAQAKLGYTFGYKWLRVGVDAGYRFAGGAQIVVKLPQMPGLQDPNTTAAPPTLAYQRQTMNVTAHDGDAGISIGGYFHLGDKLEMAVRARGGIQLQGFLPDFNPGAVLPKELLYGPSVGGLIDLQTRFAPGFAAHIEGGYIPYAVRQENDGARDAVCPANAPAGTACLNNPESSTGFYVGGTLAFRVVTGFDVEAGYRMLSSQTSYGAGSISERLRFDRDDVVKRLADSSTPPTLQDASRSTVQQAVFVGVSFRR